MMAMMAMIILNDLNNPISALMLATIRVMTKTMVGYPSFEYETRK
jgi:hypothetical protein